jgi:hypothetical protein
VFLFPLNSPPVKNKWQNGWLSGDEIGQSSYHVV